MYNMGIKYGYFNMGIKFRGDFYSRVFNLSAQKPTYKNLEFSRSGWTGSYLLG